MNFSNPKHYSCYGVNDTQELGGVIATQLPMPACVYLEGDLGAGKTTLCSSIIRGLGYQGSVTSPTYNLIQEYPVDLGIVYHMDLYRLQSPEELEFLAIADLLSETSLFLIEWSARGGPLLPAPTHQIVIKQGEENDIDREITILSAA